METIQINKPKLHFFICINERPKDHPTPSCGPRITSEDVSEIKKWIREQGLTTEIFTTKCLCLGYCNKESSVLAIYPEGKFVKYNTKDDIKNIIKEEYNKIL